MKKAIGPNDDPLAVSYDSDHGQIPCVILQKSVQVCT